MKQKLSSRLFYSLLFILFSFVVLPGVVFANHVWGPPYHWARTSNPFTLKLGDNVSTAWDAYLREASSDWNQSTVLDTTVVTGATSPKSCKPTSGRIEACNSKYGNNGWLGLAQIWVTGGEHIYQGVVKVNDFYFNMSKYNTPAWKRLVMCQEVAHNFGLDHQDENSGNPNLGSCMDYTSDPDGPPSNEHPNQHDFDQLEAIYGHLDSTATIDQSISHGIGQDASENAGENKSEWGRQVKDNGNVGLYVKDLNAGRKVYTFVTWAK